MGDPTVTKFIARDLDSRLSQREKDAVSDWENSSFPFHGMRDALYGQEERPRFPSDPLHEKFNTRWVEGKVLKQITTRSQPREESAR